MPTPSSPSPTATDARRSRFGGALLELNQDCTAEVRRGLVLRVREILRQHRRLGLSPERSECDADLRDCQHVLRQIDAQCGELNV